jgi:hypothetical protein
MEQRLINAADKLETRRQEGIARRARIGAKIRADQARIASEPHARYLPPDKAIEQYRKNEPSRTPGEVKGPRGIGKTKAQKAAATRALNIEESKRKGTYTGKASKLKQKAKVKSRAGGAAFNPKLLGRSSPTDFTRGGRGPSGIPRKKL